MRVAMRRDDVERKSGTTPTHSARTLSAKISARKGRTRYRHAGRAPKHEG
jgi:hypothetical protein